LTAAGWHHASKWGLATVVDLRCAYEVGTQEGDPDLKCENLPEFTVVNAPTEDQDNAEFRETCLPILDSPEYWRHNWRILPGLVRNALDAIAAADSGLLVHCSAGRDRTGMISTLLLGNAGVSPVDVAADYAESVRALAGASTHAPTPDRQATWSPREIEEWIAATAPIVLEIAADTDSALDMIGVSPTVRRQLRARLVEA
jgi:protein-tyrosine phosphatase